MAESNVHSDVNRSECNAHAPPQAQSNAGAAPVEQELTLSCESEYKDYKYNEKVDMWSLISLKAPPEPEDENEEKRPPIDLVAVIDKSGSMAGKKLNLVKKTLEFVLTQLNEKDRLSVVTYDSGVYLDFALRKMDKDGKDYASKKVEAIRDGSTTNLSGGLLKGLCQMIERKEKNEVASVLLFTDGLANVGIRNAEGIVAAMKDPTRFSGVSRSPQIQLQSNVVQQPPPHQGWLRSVFGNQNALPPPLTPQQMQVPQVQQPVELPPQTAPESTSSAEKKTTDASVYTFGFGADHDPNMLTKISDAGNGMYYYIENEDKIAESFAHCLGGLMSTVGQGIQLHINLEEGVSIKQVHTVKPFEQMNDKSVKIDMGDLQAEERRDIVLELTLDAVPQPYSTTPQQILKAQVDYFNVLTNQLGSKQADLSVLRPETTEVHDEEHAHKEVGKQKYRHKMTRAMAEATKAADSGNFQEAQLCLESEMAALRTKSSNASDEDDLAYFDNMTNDLCRMSEQMSSASVYRSRGKKLQSNMMQQYQVQRSSNLESKAFAKKGHAIKRLAVRSFMQKE